MPLHVGNFVLKLNILNDFSFSSECGKVTTGQNKLKNITKNPVSNDTGFFGAANQI